MPEHSHALADPRVFAGTGLDQLGAAPLRPVDPAQVGPFRLLALLGGGGMGRVYLGREPAGPGGQPAAHRGLAAVKVIRPEYAEDPQFRRRFEREAEALARVQGGPTAVLLGSGFDGDLLWMATEYIPGLSLTGTVADHGVLGPAAAWRLAADLGRAVAALERAEVVHRDIKPSNVVLGPDGCRLIDFGISQASGTSSITVTGQQVGTPAYMSPEQVRGLPVETSSDVFALGSVLAYAVTGNAPFGDGTSVDVLHRVAFEPPKPEVLDRVAAVDPDLSALVAACLDKEQDRRPTAEAVIATALTRQVPAPWPQGLSDAIMTCIQVTDAVAQLPLEPLQPLGTGAPGPAPVEGTFVLGAHTPPPFGPPAPQRPQGPHTPATVPAAADGRSAWSTPVQTAPLQAAPYQAPPVHPGAVHAGGVQATPPTEAAGRFAPYVIQAPGPQSAPAAPWVPPRQERPRRIGLLVTGAAVAVAAVAGVALLLAGSSGHASAAGPGTAGASAGSGQGGQLLPGPSPSSSAPSASASAGSSATAARPSGSASAGSSATARSHQGGSPTAGTSAAAPTQPGNGGSSTQSSAPAAAPTTATPAPPQPAWITNCQYYSGSAETDPIPGPGSTDVAAVKEIQCILTYRGYNVVDGIDGQFGPNTKNAVEAFQRAEGLGVDGEVGQQTWPALRSSS